MTGARADTLLKLMERVEMFTLGRVWHELADDELFFEPVPGMWSVRRREDCRTETPFGVGEWVVDFNQSAQPPEPMTTIAWLLWHIGTMPGRAVELEIFGGPHTIASGWTSPYLAHHEVFTSADRAVTALRDGWSALKTAIESAADDALEQAFPRYTYAAEPMRDGLCIIGPPGPEHPAVFTLASMLNEISHHGSQICVLRDLYVHGR